MPEAAITSARLIHAQPPHLPAAPGQGVDVDEAGVAAEGEVVRAEVVQQHVEAEAELLERLCLWLNDTTMHSLEMMGYSVGMGGGPTWVWCPPRE